MDYLWRLDDNEREIYKELLDNLNPTYNPEKILKEYTRKEIQEMIEIANNLPEMPRLSKRRTRLVTALAISKKRKLN